MTTDDILRMAREAGMDRKPADHNCRVDYFDVVTDSELERFAALVAAAEREECAKLFDPLNPKSDWTEYAEARAECAAAIRARGTK